MNGEKDFSLRNRKKHLSLYSYYIMNLPNVKRYFAGNFVQVSHWQKQAALIVFIFHSQMPPNWLF